MTMVTPNATPKRLKKRTIGKLGTASVALFAGAALAASSFGLTQAASAFYTPEYEIGDEEYQFTAASQDTVLFADRDNGRHLTNIGQGGGSVISGTWDSSMLDDAPTAEFSIENLSDERAIVYLDGASLYPFGEDADGNPLFDERDSEHFDELFITIVDRNESSSRNKEANGGSTDENAPGYQHQTIVENVKLSELGRHFIADVAERFTPEDEIPHGLPQTGYDYDIYLTVPETTLAFGEDPADYDFSQRELDWEFLYDAYGYEPGNDADRQEAYFRAGFDGIDGANSANSPFFEASDEVTDQFPTSDEYPSQDDFPSGE